MSRRFCLVALASLSAASFVFAAPVPKQMKLFLLDQWKAGKPLYQTAVERTREAMKQGTLAGILWHQGESDGGNPKNVATYAATRHVLWEFLGRFPQIIMRGSILGFMITPRSMPCT